MHRGSVVRARVRRLALRGGLPSLDPAWGRVATVAVLWNAACLLHHSGCRFQKAAITQTGSCSSPLDIHANHSVPPVGDARVSNGSLP